MRLWQEESRCIHCHANMHYGLARPALRGFLPQPDDYDTLLRELVEQRWPEKCLRYSMEPVVFSMALVAGDRADGVGLTPVTRIRSYVAKHKPASDYSKATLLWAATKLDGLASRPQRDEIAAHLLSFRGPDGGWAIENLIVGTQSFEHLQANLQRPSDAYAMGYIVYALRQAGFTATDPHLRPALDWLKANQRESGRWFVPTLIGKSNHLLSNSGTAWAVLALAECGELLNQTKSQPARATHPPAPTPPKP